MAAQTSVMADEKGKYDDWIEISTHSVTPVSLYGYVLTDALDSMCSLKNVYYLRGWLQPGEFKIVWLDGDLEQGTDHAPFKLTSSGETLWLLDSDMKIVDTVTFPMLKTDKSFGCVADSCIAREQLAVPSPGRSNLVNIDLHVPADGCAAIEPAARGSPLGNSKLGQLSYFAKEKRAVTDVAVECRTTGAMAVGGNVLDLGMHMSDEGMLLCGTQDVGLRVDGMEMPDDTRLMDSYLEFDITSVGSLSNVGLAVAISIETVDNGLASFSADNADLSNRLTSVQAPAVQWAVETSHAVLRTPDLSSLITAAGAQSTIIFLLKKESGDGVRHLSSENANLFGPLRAFKCLSRFSQ
jgi:hypothetical protein